MSLKRMAEYKRDDYTYTSPDGDNWQITIVQTSDRKYVEIKKSDGEVEVQWDLEMLLDISDAVRSAARQASPVAKKHKLQSPNITDHRDVNKDEGTPADHIHAAVVESLENADITIAPVESFTRAGSTIAEDVARRKSGVAEVAEPTVKRVDW